MLRILFFILALGCESPGAAPGGGDPFRFGNEEEGEDPFRFRFQEEEPFRFRVEGRSRRHADERLGSFATPDPYPEIARNLRGAVSLRSDNLDRPVWIASGFTWRTCSRIIQLEECSNIEQIVS